MTDCATYIAKYGFSGFEDTAASAMPPYQVNHRMLAAPPFFNKPFSRC
jgi:hypothetical protein